MSKALFLGSLLTLGAISAALAQEARDAPPQDQARPSAGVRAGNITSTGATVPNPGVSQGAGTTDLDRGIQREDNKISDSICKGC